jgi:CheY-like chemotaxis protein
MNTVTDVPAPRRILCIEDEPDIQVIARLALETVGGFQMKMCSSGAEALGSANAFQPDLILLDVMMPDMDGPATLSELRKLPGMAKVPVIFMTAKTQHQEIETFLNQGALGVITKPFDPMHLAREIHGIWKRYSSAAPGT